MIFYDNNKMRFSSTIHHLCKSLITLFCEQFDVLNSNRVPKNNANMIEYKCTLFIDNLHDSELSEIEKCFE